jgi:uncharacterized membrane protein YgcG
MAGQRVRSRSQSIPTAHAARTEMWPSRGRSQSSEVGIDRSSASAWLGGTTRSSPPWPRRTGTLICATSPKTHRRGLFARLTSVHNPGGYSRRVAPWLVVAMFAWLGLPAAALGQAPRLESHVTDLTGSLSNPSAIEGAITQVDREDGVETWVLFVPTIGAQTPADYAQEVATRNSLGVDDALILVVVDDRTDQIWLSDGLEEITNAELDEVIGDVLEPRLAAGDFDGAVIAAAQGLGDAATGIVAPPEPGPNPPGQPEGQGSGIGWLIAVVLIGAGLWLVVTRFRRLRDDRRTAEERDRRVGELARRANALLVAADEAVRDAESEVGFAEAQFGPEEAQALREAAASARDEVRAAFAIRQQLDDGVPEDAATRERLLGEIVARAEKSDQLLDAAAQRLAELRTLERDLPSVLPRVREEIEAVGARLPAAEATLDRLESVAGGSLGPVRGNAVEARKRVDDALAELQRVDGDVRTGRTSEAARRVRLIERVGAEAGTLLGAIDELDAAVRDVLPKVDPALAEAERSVTAGDVAATSPGAATSAQLTEARIALAQARAARDASPPDPVSAYREATRADQLADAATADLRDAAERLVRQRSIADAAVTAADARVLQATQFITARHLGVGHAARTRLAESERWLERAHAKLGEDDAGAAGAAQQAAALAEAAYRSAQSDFDQFDQFGRPSTGGDVLQSVLPYVLPILLRGAGGWGRTRWGESRGGGIFGGDGGGIFGGGGGGGGGILGGGGGRSSGGSFGGFGGGGGGGRSRGGRW